MKKIDLSGLRAGGNPQPTSTDGSCFGSGPRRTPLVVLEKLPEDIAGLVKELQSAVEEYERLVSETKTNIEKAEDARFAAEKVRAKAEELRIAAEEERAASEAARQSAYELIASALTAAENDRVAAETLRESAEALRQSTFETNEKIRAAAHTSQMQSQATAYTNAEAYRNGAYQEAEEDRDGIFNLKEATRDAANQAALGCAETLAALGPKIGQIDNDVNGFDWSFTTSGSGYQNKAITLLAGVEYTIVNGCVDYIQLRDSNNIQVTGTSSINRGATAKITLTQEQAAAVTQIAHCASGTVTVTSPSIADQLATKANALDVTALAGVVNGVSSSIDKKVEQKLGKNIFNTNVPEATKGLMLLAANNSVNGTLTYSTSSAANICVLIFEWGDNTSLTLNCNYLNGTVYCQIDDDNVVKEVVTPSLFTTTISKATGATKVALTLNYATTNAMISWGSSLPAYESYNPIAGYLVSADEGEGEGGDTTPTNTKVGNNLLSDMVVGGLLNNGSVSSAFTDFRVSNKIPFGSQTKITTNCFLVGSGLKNCIYDDEDNCLASFNDATVDKSEYPTATYARFTLYVQWFTKPQISYGDNVGILYPYNEIARETQIEYSIITANSDEDSDADFVGNLAIRNAIASITDATYYKRYIIRARGQFTATKPSDYEYRGGVGQFAMFWLPEYVELDGGHPRDCIIKSYLSPDIEDNQTAEEDAYMEESRGSGSTFVKADYSNFQPLFIAFLATKVSNVTLICENTRYPLHIVGANSENFYGQEVMVDRCVLINNGKHGDSEETTSESASGFGNAAGCTLHFKNCEFISKSSLYNHDSQALSATCNVIWEDCIVRCFGSYESSKSIVIENISNRNGVNVTINSCKLPRNSVLHIHDIIKSRTNVGDECEFADTIRVSLMTDMEAIPVYCPGASMGLRIVSSTTTGSSVRFDITSSAFDDIVGDSTKTIKVENNAYGRREQYGYQWRDGGANLNAEAIGMRNLISSVATIGQRLGNCTSTNKTLGVIVDGTSISITFNRNYTSMSDADVIADINTALNGAATASLYSVNQDWFPLFNGTRWEFVDDDNSIIKGMGVCFTASGVRRAESTDTIIDGIAIDSGVDGDMVRVVTKGRVYRGIIQRDNTLGYGVVAGTLAGIGATSGTFSTNATNKTIRVGGADDVELI